MVKNFSNFWIFGAKLLIDPMTANVIALIAAIAAIISAVYAYKSKAVALKALSIAREELDLKKDNLYLYLVEGFSYHLAGNKRILAFNISITNRSLTGNSLDKLDIQISFVRPDNTIGAIVMPHDWTLSSSIPNNALTVGRLPMTIPPKSAISCWALFPLPPSVLMSNRIEKYTLKIMDISGNSGSADCYIVKDIIVGRNEENDDV